MYCWALVFVFCFAFGYAKDLVYEIEEECTSANGTRGVCIPQNECIELVHIIDVRVLKNFICGYKGIIPRVCCPRSDTETTSSPSATSNATTTQPPKPTVPSSTAPTTTAPITETPIARIISTASFLPSECGNGPFLPSRIVNGTKSPLGLWPWLAAVYLTRSGLSRGTDCGGALVTHRHVITAAHCVSDRRGNVMDASMFTVRLGEHILNDDNDGANPIDFRVERIARHENFVLRTFKNDIAVLTLQGRVQFTKLISPVCLPYGELEGDDLAGVHGYVAGWGTTAFDGEFNPVLTHIYIPIVTNEACKELFKNEVPISEEYICAGVSDGSKDSCQGDSGGPLVIPTANKKYYLVGVVSFGKRCATPGFPGVYARVTVYLDWLATHLRN